MTRSNTTGKPPRRSTGSCPDCFAWGPLWTRGRCTACYGFDRLHQQGRCQACARLLALKKGFCRLCWTEASRRANLERNTTGKGVQHDGPLAPFLREISTQQLYFTDMARTLTLHAPASTSPRTRELQEPFQPPIGPGQLRLFEAHRDLTRARLRPTTRRQWLDAALEVPHVAAAWAAAQRKADTLGWSAGVLAAVRATLLAALCCRPADEPVRYSELAPLPDRDLSLERAAEVLAEVGMLDDDRPGPMDEAFERHLKNVAPAIRADTQDWLTQLITGTSRTRPRKRATAAEYLRAAAPVLIAWSRDHEHLREITASQVTQSLAELPPGSPRTQALIALRSLFRYLRAEKRVFRNPTSRIKPGPSRTNVLLPLEDADYERTSAAATTPEQQLALVLAAVLAARPAGIAALELNDVDLGNRHINIAGQHRRLDDLAYEVIQNYLTYRRSRWPGTANPHLLISQQTAHDARPVTSYYLSRLFYGRGISLDRMRRDRWLEEALNRGPDPLHLAAVFGISEGTAMRYARAARTILENGQAKEQPG